MLHFTFYSWFFFNFRSRKIASLPPKFAITGKKCSKHWKRSTTQASFMLTSNHPIFSWYSLLVNDFDSNRVEDLSLYCTHNIFAIYSSLQMRLLKPWGSRFVSTPKKSQSRWLRKSWQLQKVSLDNRDILILSRHVQKVRKVLIETEKSVETWHFWQISTVCLNLDRELVNVIKFLNRDFSICRDFWSWSTSKSLDNVEISQ